MSIDLLQQAVDAAKNGNRAEAIKLTKDYIRQTPKDARGWWALTKFTDDPEVQRECLKRVLKLKPDHAQAQQMLDDLETTSASFDFSFNDSSTPQSSQTPSFDFGDEDDDLSSSFEPEINYFSDVDSSPSPSMFSDVRHDSAAAKAQVRSQSTSGGGEWMIGIGVFLLAIVALAGLAFYAYQYQYYGIFGLFGPDLTKTAQTRDFTIRYGSDWNVQVEGPTFVAASNNLPAISSENLDYASLADSSSGFGMPIQSAELCYEDLQDDSVMVVISPFVDELSTEFQRQTGFSSFQEFVNSQQLVGDIDLNDFGQELDGIDFGVGSDQSDVSVDGENATLVSLRMNMEVDDNSPFYSLFVAGMSESMCGNIDGDFKLNLALYMTAIQHNNIEYMFMLITFGDKAKSHERTAKRMLGSMEFLN